MPPIENLRGHYSKERRYRRYDLRVPVCLSFPSASAVCELRAISKNVSLGGLLLKSGERIAPGTPVSLRIELRVRNGGRPVRLVGQGQVVRVEALGAGTEYALAIECNHPIMEMEDYLLAAV
jgi:hypothetical protein